MESNQSPSKAIVAIIVVVLLVAAATAVVVLGNKSASNLETASDLPLSTSSETINPNATFKDGTYSATGKYNSPGGEESIDVTVTLADKVITSVSVVPHANVDEAAQYQSQFVSAYKSQVVGKKISDVHLSRVAGSSLTSGGFNSALSNIAKQAEV